MKDQVIALVEAVRLAQLEIACYQDLQCGGDAEGTVGRLARILGAVPVREAMALLAPDAESPSIVPDNENLADASQLKH